MIMWWLVIVLALIAILANVFMDEIRFHWDQFFVFLFKPGGSGEKWFNPAISWRNKYIFKSRILNFLVGTVFVMFTDFWHFLKSIIINCVIAIIILLQHPQGWHLIDYVAMILALNLAWGFVFETFGGIISGIGDMVRLKKSK